VRVGLVVVEIHKSGHACGSASRKARRSDQTDEEGRVEVELGVWVWVSV
jgi:hypothetical protein